MLKMYCQVPLLTGVLDGDILIWIKIHHEFILVMNINILTIHFYY